MATPPLNYFQQSPVRGQLEAPDDAYGRAGWRYLQCTDTPNEIRVLIPPRTAALYAELLRAELAELAKDRGASWDALVAIRRLKDRAVRKCHRIARAAIPPAPPAVRALFTTAHAPPDFRVKEMERWLKAHGVDIVHPPIHDQHPPPPVTVIPTPAPHDCPKCARIQAAQAAQATGTGSSTLRRAPRPPTQRPPQRPPGTPPASGPHRPGRSPSPSPGKRAGKLPQTRPSARQPIPRVRSGDQLKQRSIDQLTGKQRARLAAKSPEPLPIPFRTHADPPSPHSSHSTGGSLGGSLDKPGPVVADTLSESPPQGSPDAPAALSPIPESPLDAPPATSDTQDELPAETGGAPHRPLVRRRSSLKQQRAPSVASQAKSVAWAMDRDWLEQMERYARVAGDAEVLGEELAALRTEHASGLATMRTLCTSAAAAAARVRAELDALQASEAAVRTQEAALVRAGERVQAKELQLQDAVVAVLEEAKRVVRLCDRKRDGHDAD